MKREADFMRRAGLAVTDGLPVGITKEHVVCYPQCLGDVRRPTDKGQAMWLEIQQLIESGNLKEVA